MLSRRLLSGFRNFSKHCLPSRRSFSVDEVPPKTTPRSSSTRTARTENATTSTYATSASASRYDKTPTSQSWTYMVNIQDEADFKTKVLSSSIPVLVDFYAEWCGPCKLLSPRLDKILSTLPSNTILLAKVNVDAIEALSNEYRISALPTLIGMKNGREVSRRMGVLEEAELLNYIKSIYK